MFGAYADDEPWPDVSAHYALERKVGRLPTMSWFQDWGTGWLATAASAAQATRHNILIAWDPSQSGVPLSFADIAAGRYDDYLVKYFRGARTFRGQVVLRPFWEMNGNYSSYSVAAPSDGRAVASTSEWIAVWRHLVTLQRRVGGANVHFMFCANGSDVGGTPVEQYWPGAAYVDRLGLDTYNGGTPWQPAHGLIAPMYDRLAALHPTAPISVAEIGCAESSSDPGRKAAWLRNLFTDGGFPRLNGLCFFDADKEHDWRLDSSSQALAVSRSYLASAPLDRMSVPATSLP